MKKLFVSLMLALAVLAAAPKADAYTLEEQRKDVYVALLPVIQDVKAERLAKIDAFEASTDPEERALLYQQIRVLGSRQRYLTSMRFDARYRYSGTQLDTIINRYDLAVSRS